MRFALCAGPSLHLTGRHRALVQQLEHQYGSAAHENLSPREFQVFLKLAEGKTAGDVSDDLSLRVKTVSTYLTRLLEKMGLSTKRSHLLRSQALADLVRCVSQARTSLSASGGMLPIQLRRSAKYVQRGCCNVKLTALRGRRAHRLLQFDSKSRRSVGSDPPPGIVVYALSVRQTLIVQQSPENTLLRGGLGQLRRQIEGPSLVERHCACLVQSPARLSEKHGAVVTSRRVQVSISGAIEASPSVRHIRPRAGQ
jgi:DNA-binding CsgD family transcriptional regulator